MVHDAYHPCSWCVGVFSDSGLRGFAIHESNDVGGAMGRRSSNHHSRDIVRRDSFAFSNDPAITGDFCA